MTAAPPPGGLPVASIDDLLGHDDDEPVLEARRPSSARFWVRNALLVGIAAAATLGALRMVGVQVNPLLVLAAFVALRMLHHIVGGLAPPPLPRAAGRRRTAADEGTWHWQGTDGLLSAVRRWEQQLNWAQSDAGRFSRNVLPVLAELADERLRLRHGITRASDPQRARELLGDPLWRLLAEPDHPPPKARDLTAHVGALEKL
jgi:hypothetical protein